jgi:co-chaperonin GroES (HSP10)
MFTKWKPAGQFVLVAMDKVPEKVGSIIMPPAKTEREEMAHMEGTLVAVGCDAWADRHTPAKVGDRVLFAKYAGFLREENGVKYRVMHDLDIVMVLHKENNDD